MYDRIQLRCSLSIAGAGSPMFSVSSVEVHGAKQVYV